MIFHLNEIGLCLRKELAGLSFLTPSDLFCYTHREWFIATCKESFAKKWPRMKIGYAECGVYRWSSLVRIHFSNSVCHFDTVLFVEDPSSANKVGKPENAKGEQSHEGRSSINPLIREDVLWILIKPPRLDKCELGNSSRPFNQVKKKQANCYNSKISFR